ncbi:MAG: phosphoketolase family protein [Solirubrobacterales bacterium]|nr:phosphoketolase family protein [Solirubrobacterales bacterium]MBV9715627.1 phosphoketolase family protein [Solirubrobacterales bacterium]
MSTEAPAATTHGLALYRRATNYIAAAMIYLQDNHMLEEPLKPEHIKPRLLGHWGTVPGINLVYAGLNRLILATDASVLLITGPGHGAPANLANLWIDGCLEDVRPDLSRDRAGLGHLVRSFSWPGGFPSHLAPMVPGTIHEGGELGYALATAFGAALDNPDLIVACIVGDGEAETGPTAGAWHSNKFLDPATGGAVLPILHVNGYKIANPTIYGTMSDEELTKLFEGFGWHPMIVQGDDLDAALASALDAAYGEICALQSAARDGNRPARPRWPMLVLRSPKGWTGIRELDGVRVEGTSKAHQVPAMQARTNPEHLRALEQWLRSYRPEELLDERGGPSEAIRAMCPTGERRMGANPHVNGGRMRVPLRLPELSAHVVEVTAPGAVSDSALGTLGKYLADVLHLNREHRNFRIMCPDEVASNRLGAVFEASGHTYEWPVDRELSPDYAPDGRIMEVLSEHNCQGWLQGYVLTGRHGIFPCYEAFIPIVDGMVNQYSKFLKMSREEAKWREPVSSLNYLLTSVGWRQDHNGYSHQMPGFINSMLNRREDTARVYLPPDTNTLLATMAACLEAKGQINLVIASKHPLPTWLTMEDAVEHVRRGASRWAWASSDHDAPPDVVLAACGTIPTIELLAATSLLRQEVPELRVRFVNVTNLFSLARAEAHRDGMSEDAFREVFTDDKPVIFNFHGYPSAVHQLIHRRPRQERFHVRGYAEEGTTTTPFDLLAMNGVDRFQLAIDALSRADVSVAEMVTGMSGAFAVRTVPGAREAIDRFNERRTELRRLVREQGDDPPEIKSWVWTSGESVPA